MLNKLKYAMYLNIHTRTPRDSFIYAFNEHNCRATKLFFGSVRLENFFSAKYCFISNCLKLLLIHCHRTNDWFILFRMQFRVRTLEQMCCCCCCCCVFCYSRIMSHIKSVCFIYFIESIREWEWVSERGRGNQIFCQ